MAYELQAPGLATGLTLSAKLYAGGALVATVSLTESPASSGVYGNASDLSLAGGNYAIAVVDGSGNKYATGTLLWDGAAEVMAGNVVLGAVQGPYPPAKATDLDVRGLTLANINNIIAQSTAANTGATKAAAATLLSHSGTARAGSTSTTIVLATTASAVDGTYVGQTIRLTGATGAGQARVITAYASKVATVDAAWVTVPDATTAYSVVGDAGATTATDKSRIAASAAVAPAYTPTVGSDGKVVTSNPATIENITVSSETVIACPQ